MQLLKGIDIAPFVRIIWSSRAARAEWEPKIAAAAQAYHRLERETVKAGLRHCTTAHVAPDRVNEVGRELAKQGLVFLPYKKVGCYEGFAHYHPPVVDGQPWSYYGPIAARIKDAELFCASEDSGDHDTIASLLGYPACCSAFFRQVWMRGYIDPVWQAAVTDETVTEARTRPSIIFDGLRYIGVRLAPHLPCSFDCVPSLEIANAWIALARDQHITGIDDLLELLRLPLEWNCLKGIAEVTTEHFRVVTNSMACWPKHTLWVMP